MVVSGLDAIKKYRTREEEVELKNDLDGVYARIKMSRLPINELFGYYSMFEKIDQNNPNSMFSRKNVEMLMNYIASSVLSANKDAKEDEVKEFVATNFMVLFEPFSNINGGGMSVAVPENVLEQLKEKNEHS